MYARIRQSSSVTTSDIADTINSKFLFTESLELAESLTVPTLTYLSVGQIGQLWYNATTADQLFTSGNLAQISGGYLNTVILKSPDGSYWDCTLDSDGAFVTTSTATYKVNNPVFDNAWVINIDNLGILSTATTTRPNNIPLLYGPHGLILHDELSNRWKVTVMSSGHILTTPLFNTTPTSTVPPYIITSPNGTEYTIGVDNDGGIGMYLTSSPGSLIVAGKTYTSLTEEDTNYVYFATALQGSLVTASVWKVWRRDKTTNLITRADGNKLFDNLGQNLHLLSYS